MLQSQLIKGRILSALLMFYAAWLHLQRETLIAVNDYTSGCCRLSSQLRIRLPERQAQLPHCEPWGFDPKVGKEHLRASTPVFFPGTREHSKGKHKEGVVFFHAYPSFCEKELPDREGK